jgi:hypothetical protein
MKHFPNNNDFIDYVMSFMVLMAFYPMNANPTVVRSATADCMQIAQRSKVKSSVLIVSTANK